MSTSSSTEGGSEPNLLLRGAYGVVVSDPVGQCWSTWCGATWLSSQWPSMNC